MKCKNNLQKCILINLNSLQLNHEKQYKAKATRRGHFILALVTHENIQRVTETQRLGND